MGDISNFILCEYGLSYKMVDMLDRHHIHLETLQKQQLEKISGLGKDKIQKILLARAEIMQRRQQHSVFELQAFGLSKNIIRYLFENKISLEALLLFDDYYHLSKKFKLKLVTAQKIARSLGAYKKKNHLSDQQEPNLAIILESFKQGKFKEAELLDYLDEHIDQFGVLSLESLSRQLNELVANKVLKRHGSYYYQYVPNLKDEIAEINNDRERDILLKRLNHHTLEQIGQAYGISRERVRQIIIKTFNSFPVLKEDKYAPDYQKYYFDKDSFCRLFNENELVYNYLSVRYVKGSKNLSAYKNEHKLTDEQRVIINEKLNLYVEEDNTEIEIKKNNVMIQALKEENRALNVKQIIALYNEKIKENNFALAPIDNTHNHRRTVAGILSRSDMVIASTNYKYRYYDINGLEPSQKQILINTLLIHSGFYSTKYFINKYPYIIKNYGIRDEYELHNLLKRIVHDERIIFLRMPHLLINCHDKDTFFKNLLDQQEPIAVERLVALVYDMTGYHKDSFAAYLKQNFNKYITDDIVNTKEIIYDSEQYEKISRALTANLYDIAEFKEIAQKCFNSIVDEEYLNSRNFDSLGYKYRHNYIFKKEYHTLAGCLRAEILSKDFYKIKKYNPTISITLYGVLKSLESSLDLLKISGTTYITATGLHKKHISKNGLYIIIKEIIDQMPSYVNGYYACAKMNVDLSYLKEYHDNSYFIDSILKSSKRLHYVKYSEGYLFSKQALSKGQFYGSVFRKTHGRAAAAQFILENYKLKVEDK